MTAAARLNRELFDHPERWRRLGDDPAEGARLERLAQLVPADVGSVLDVGCGTGAWLERLADRCMVLGVEPSLVARRLARVPVVNGNATGMAMPDAAFDLVGCHEVLEHLDDGDLPTACAELARLARRYLLISVPYREAMALRTTRCPGCGRRFHVDGHMRRFAGPQALARRFPAFRVARTLLHGQTTGYRFEPLARRLASRMGRWAREPLARCPSCAAPAEGAAPRTHDPLAPLLAAIEWRLRRPQPRWMTLLLTREEANG